ncbi:F-box only protein 48 [Narcine bancroftii]|uniref:F-box only protein 48 n=1 Tax=Narcine bancroftii TaxID=1343680 RepID=UPI003831EF56
MISNAEKIVEGFENTSTIVEQAKWKDFAKETNIMLLIKVTLVRNYMKNNIKQAWLNGHYSYIHSASELLRQNMCEMDTAAWGEILEAELER